MTECNKVLTHRSFTEVTGNSIPFVMQYVTQAYFKNIDDGQVRKFDDSPLVVCFVDVRFNSSWFGR